MELSSWDMYNHLPSEHLSLLQLFACFQTVNLGLVLSAHALMTVPLKYPPPVPLSVRMEGAVTMVVDVTALMVILENTVRLKVSLQ